MYCVLLQVRRNKFRIYVSTRTLVYLGIRDCIVTWSYCTCGVTVTVGNSEHGTISYVIITFSNCKITKHQSFIKLYFDMARSFTAILNCPCITSLVHKLVGYAKNGSIMYTKTT